MHDPTVSRPLGPLYKLYLFGRFRIERRDPQGHYHPLPPDTWDRQSPRRVLTYLLLAPGRHTLKDPLLDALCPDDELDRAQAALSQALSLVRHVLVDEQGFPLLLPRKATPQKPLVLAGREQIWCDWDAFQDTLMQAQAAEQQGKDALPLWEQAYALCQEEFLLEERYSDWCREVRERAEGDQRLCLLHLATCYQEQGRRVDAERLLRAWLCTHALDQDALCRLMEVLASQGRVQEALVWYQRTCEVLEEEGMEVTQHTQDLAQSLQTPQTQPVQCIAEVPGFSPASEACKDGAVQHAPVQGPETEKEQGEIRQARNAGLFFLPAPLKAEFSSFLLPSTQHSGQGAEYAPPDGAAQLGILLAEAVTLIQQWYGMALFCHELQNHLDQRIRALDMLKTRYSLEAYALSRRSFLISLATLPATWLASHRQTHKIMLEPEELLPQCAASLTACWHLSSGSLLETIPPLIDEYLPILIAMVEYLPPYRETAADLVAQCYFLKAILAWHLEGLDCAEAYCIQAMQYSDMTNNVNLRLTALNQHALIAYYARDFAKALAKSEEARETLLHASHEHFFPIIQGRVYMYLAAFQAQQAHPDAERTLDQARRAFALQAATQEVVPLYADCGQAPLKLWEGLTHYHLSFQDKAHIQPALDALRAFGRIQSNAQIPERFRLECLNNRILAAIQAGDRDEALSCLKTGRQGAISLESKQRHLELDYAMREMRERWPKEERL